MKRAEEARATAKEMDAEEEEYMKEQSAMRKKDKESNKQLAESLDGKSKDTMSIIKHLSKNIPEESIDEEPDLEIEDSEEDHPILKKKKKMKILKVKRKVQMGKNNRDRCWINEHSASRRLQGVNHWRR